MTGLCFCILGYMTGLCYFIHGYMTGLCYFIHRYSRPVLSFILFISHSMQVKTEPDTDNMTKDNMTAAVSTNILSASEPHSEPDSADNPFDGFELSQQMQRETGKSCLSLNS